METSRRAQGCWTCKGRKIGCDRGSPSCNNCVRTGRTCGGYGIRLHWPDEPDGRRRITQLPLNAFFSPSNITANYGKQFLNMTFSDLQLVKSGLAQDLAMLQPQAPRRPSRPIYAIPNLHERESYLINYYTDRLSSMISTIDVNNGFRDEILPMAFASPNKASDGLRNAILALSAYHMWGNGEALWFKHQAIRSLSSSFDDPKNYTPEQLATSMMLCVYNVFDPAEGNWSIHLMGARTVLRQQALMYGGQLPPSFLCLLYLYHEILGEFVSPQVHHKNGPKSLELLQGSSFDKTAIVGLLGCSVEVFEIISYVNGLRASKLHQNTKFSPEQRKRQGEEWHEMEHRIGNLTQHLRADDREQLSQSEQQRIGNTAELYRIATLLYLHRSCDSSQTAQLRANHLDQALEILGNMEVCTSPWPLFVIACETDDDAKRIQVLATLDGMDNQRHIGNIFVLRNIIESFWKHQDLQADSGRPNDLPWWDVVDLKTASPWFI